MTDLEGEDTLTQLNTQLNKSMILMDTSIKMESPQPKTNRSIKINTKVQSASPHNGSPKPRKKTTNSTLCLSDLSDSEDIWIMDIPRTIDPRELKGQTLIFGEKSKFKVNKERYYAVNHEVKCNITCVLKTDKAKSQYKTVNIKPAGSFTVRRKLSSVSKMKPMKIENYSVPFPKNLRSRHPLFGVSYEETNMSVLNQSGEDAVECPLCMEPLEVDDLNFFPCTCGYQICRFCWHRIRTDENGLCPACRKAYSENPADFKPLSMEEIARLKAEKRLKDQQRKQRVTENRKHLANVRVVQKNLVFVVGLPLRLADADILKRHEYFGKFGKIHKVVINQSTSYAGSQGPSASAYVTYQRQEDALRAIEAVNNVVMDGRTIKTSLGTTKYCSHFMRNQPCPKPDCMYLHDLGDQEASFTKEEMHQGKHQEYERKLVQSLHASHASAQRKPTPSPSVTGSIVRENGTSNSQAKEAWPSLQTGQTNSSQTNCKELSPPSQTTSQQNNIINGNGTTNQQNHVSSGGSTQQQNNNNKGENMNIRRGKSNSESKAQAARNKHKNCQNKEKHSTRTTSRSESSSIGSQNNVQPQINGQKDIRNFSSETNSDVIQKLGNKCKSEQQQPQPQQQSQQPPLQQQQSQSQHQQQNSKGSKLIQQQQQQSQELKVNGVVQNGERRHSDSETDQQREGSTPASTISSTEDSNVNHQAEHLAESSEENNGAAILGKFLIFVIISICIDLLIFK
ncbi:CCR4-NOT transcription complex subunit 4 [Habropoda laboriosa]|uniref:CCR4-NOT transcription complex subunit 4 n=1 Tax=Habropoda laboriosa TaxID=597456 RepID=A0A0L7QQ46_9HYME|nr:CCR4-NOT transcription complex subunit 4 [Habropoda laboriosa]